MKRIEQLICYKPDGSVLEYYLGEKTDKGEIISEIELLGNLGNPVVRISYSNSDVVWQLEGFPCAYKVIPSDSKQTVI